MLGEGDHASPNTAAQIAGSVSAPINQLLTIDPLPRRSVDEFRSNVQVWPNVNAQPSKPNLSASIAHLGAQDGALPTELAGTSYSMHTNLKNFESMMRPRALSSFVPESMLHRFGTNFGPVPASAGQNVRFPNPPAPAQMVIDMSFWLRNLFIVLAATTSTGCAGLKDNFIVTSVEVASPLEEPRFSPPGQWQAKRLEGNFLKVSVSSRDDISKLAERRRLNIGVSARFCDAPEGRRMWILPDLFYGDARINYNGVEKPELQHVQYVISQLPPAAKKVYHFYAEIQGVETDEHLETRVPYNLASDQRDVCAKIRGGGMPTIGFESNVIIISKEAIRAAIATKP